MVLREIRGENSSALPAASCWSRCSVGALILRQFGLQPGDRCALLGAELNFQWAVARPGADGGEASSWCRCTRVRLPLNLRHDEGLLAEPLFVSDAASGRSRGAGVAESAARASRLTKCLGKRVPREGNCARRRPYSARRRTGHDHLHFGHLRRAERRLPEHGKSESHVACTTERLDQLMGATRESGPRVSLLAI